MIKRGILSVLMFSWILSLSMRSDAQQLELNSSSYSTTNGPVTASGPATFRKNTATSATFSAYTPTTTFSVSISNQQYTSAALPGVTVGYTSTALFKPVKDGVGSGIASSSYFTSSPNPATSGTNFNTTDNHGFMIYVEPGYQKLTNQPLNARNHYADMTVTFNRPVVNPVLHFCGIGKARSTVIAPPPSYFYLGDEYQGFYSEFELSSNDVNNGISLTRLSGDSHFSVVGGNKIVNNNTATSASASNWSSLEAFLSAGSVRVNSGGEPITSVTFRIYLRGDGGTNHTGYGAKWPDMTACIDEFTLSASLGLTNLSGTVREDENGMIGGVDGDPMAGVTVGLYEKDGSTLLTTTNTNAAGYYEFLEIPGGAYVVKATSPSGYSHVSSTDASPTDGSTSVALDGINNVSGVDFGLKQQGALSVRWVNFEVMRKPLVVELQWVTVAEKSNKGFYIERSQDGITWNVLGFEKSLSADGNSTEKLSYSYVDVAPAVGNNMYRLKQVDFDGGFEYSVVRNVKFETSTDVELYPNPATENITITGLRCEEMIVVTDLSGKVVLERNVSDNIVHISLAGLTDGIYFVTIKGSDGVKSHKLVKLK